MVLLRGDAERPFQPARNLAYAAFRLAAAHTLYSTGAPPGPDGQPTLTGCLACIPILAGVPNLVQLDVLARLWRRHADEFAHEVNVFWAAALYAVFEGAAKLLEDRPELCRELLALAPRRVRLRLTERTPGQLRAAFRDFWPSTNFALLDRLVGRAPLPAARALDELDVDWPGLAALLALRQRRTASPRMLRRLTDLLPRTELLLAVLLLDIDHLR
jgi:hypothetical protein